MGVLGRDNIVHKGAKGISSASKSVKVLNWAMAVINGYKDLPAGYDTKHSGSCGRCGRELTDPESIKRGLGPTCAEL